MYLKVISIFRAHTVTKYVTDTKIFKIQKRDLEYCLPKMHVSNVIKEDIPIRHVTIR